MKNAKVLIILSIFISFFLLKPMPVYAKSKWLIIEAEVLEIGKSPGILCGVVAPYRIAKYKVEKVIEGIYKNGEIVVDHLFCRSNVLEDLKPGDKVLLVIDPKRKPAEIWEDGVIRKPQEKVGKFYVAYRLAKLTSCCVF